MGFGVVWALYRSLQRNYAPMSASSSIINSVRERYDVLRELSLYYSVRRSFLAGVEEQFKFNKANQYGRLYEGVFPADYFEPLISVDKSYSRMRYCKGSLLLHTNFTCAAAMQPINHLAPTRLRSEFVRKYKQGMKWAATSKWIQPMASPYRATTGSLGSLGGAHFPMVTEYGS